VGVADDLCRHFPTPQFWHILHHELLAHKVKFPLLEYVANQLYHCIPQPEQLAVVEKLADYVQDGSSVIAGKILQLRLPHNLPEAFKQATHNIIKGDAWTHCDHIGERVFGHGALTHFDEALPHLTTLLQHDNQWVRRAVGVAGHYATKKGLPTTSVEPLLDLLMTQANSKNYEVQRGVGWGLKTIAKFHPHLMQAQLAGLPAISRPIMSKIKTGLATADSRAGL
jgi:hypothetical protein